MTDHDLGQLPDEERGDYLTDEEFFEYYGTPRNFDPDLYRKQQVEDEL